MNKQQLVAQALGNIRKRQTAALDKCDNTLSFLRSHTDWSNNEHKLRLATIAEVMSNNSEQMLAAQKEKQQYLQIQKRLLDKYNVTETMLKPSFACNKCNDSGYVDGQMCSCLKQELQRLLIAECNIPHQEYTFANSKETDTHNQKVYARAQQICKEKSHNILLFGNVGLGKTYLLTACANQCVQEGKTVIFTTAYGLNQTFLQCHLADLSTKQAMLDNLVETDVLCIDDLGTETTYKNVTAEYLFTIVNERLTRGKQTFITTNLSIAQLRDCYDERIFSRLINQQNNLVAQLNGSDKRTQK